MHKAAVLAVDDDQDLSPSLPRDNCRFLTSLARWLARAEKKQAFDKAVLVGSARTIVDLQPAISKRLNHCVKLAPDETLVKNASEDCLAKVMWH